MKYKISLEWKSEHKKKKKKKSIEFQDKQFSCDKEKKIFVSFHYISFCLFIIVYSIIFVCIN